MIITIKKNKKTIYVKCPSSAAHSTDKILDFYYTGHNKIFGDRYKVDSPLVSQSYYANKRQNVGGDLEDA